MKVMRLQAVVFFGLLLYPAAPGAWGQEIAGRGDASTNSPYVDSDSDSDDFIEATGTALFGSVLIEVDGYHAGHCQVCDEYSDYSCSPYGSFPGWGWPTIVGFADPVPVGTTVTRIRATVNGIRCPSYGGTGATTVLVNGTALGSFTAAGYCA